MLNFCLLFKMSEGTTTEEPPLCPPPPLMAIDHPNPPNVVISTCTRIPGTESVSTTTSPCCSATDHANQFMLNTRQILTASRLDPDLLTSCANKDVDDVDLDRMYMEAMLEDFKTSVGR